MPLRPIVSSIGSVTYQLSKHLASLLGPLVGMSDRHIRDTKDFVDKIHDLSINDHECMVSFDVKALFTSIPVQEAINSVERLLILHGCKWRDRTSLTLDSILRLLEFVLSTTYFVYDGKFYQQNFGCAMGSPVSPIIANLFMEDYEEWALDDETLAPRIWFRYVDDTFTVLDRDKVELFHESLNEVNPHIQFTREEENDQGELPFLDVLVRRMDDGCINTSIYRKPTHTDHYLNWTSHHPLHQKVGVIQTLSNRANIVSGRTSDLRTEKSHLTQALRGCNYPEWAIKKGFKRRGDRANKQEENDVKGFSTIPYVKGVSEPISRILRSAGLKVAMKPHMTMKQLLGTPKDKDVLLDKAGVVYQIGCKDCDASYVGQTGRHLRERLKEHNTALEKGNIVNSGVAEHAYEAHHNIDMANVRVLDTESNQSRRLVREALRIRHLDPAMNRDRGIELPVPYLKLVQTGGGRHNTTGSDVTVPGPDHQKS